MFKLILLLKGFVKLFKLEELHAIMDEVAVIDLYPKVTESTLECALSVITDLGGKSEVYKKAGNAINVVSRLALNKIPQLEKVLKYVDLLFVYALDELNTTLKPQQLEIAGRPAQVYAENMEPHTGTMSGNGSCAHYLGTVNPNIEGEPDFRYLIQAIKPRFVREGLQAAVTTFHYHIKNTEGFRLAAGNANVLIQTAGQNPIIKDLSAGFLETVLPHTYHQVVSIVESDEPIEFSSLTTLLMSHYEHPSTGLTDHYPLPHTNEVRASLDQWLSKLNINYDQFFAEFPNHQCYLPR